MTTLIIARHGNTFEEGQPPRRVGARTDLPLTEKGRVQAQAIGRWLKDNRLVPDAAYSSTLARTRETAALAVRAAGHPQHIYTLDIFNEIDYGPDEDKPESDVIARIGAPALKNWDEHGIVPPGWLADPTRIMENWRRFADQIRVHDDNETVLAVTSNGIARFAPYLTGDIESFRKSYKSKIATGALCVLVYEDGKWEIRAWNVTPEL